MTRSILGSWAQCLRGAWYELLSSCMRQSKESSHVIILLSSQHVTSQHVTSICDLEVVASKTCFEWISKLNANDSLLTMYYIRWGGLGIDTGMMMVWLRLGEMKRISGRVGQTMLYFCNNNKAGVIFLAWSTFRMVALKSHVKSTLTFIISPNQSV